MEHKKFKVGDAVAWQSGGTEKHGKVVEVIPSGDDVRRDHWEMLYPLHSIQFRVDGNRDHESYLVSVKTGYDGRGKPRLYWPRVSALCED